ncbi:MAG: FAD-dependent oxidoreductase [Curvibacter sp.]|nr:MAG: FAD-dependent oxidoreductase [Curvibacter sp.]
MSVLQQPPQEADLHDLCVVGAGPVGLSLALAAQARGLRVLVVEAGRQDPAQSAPDWSGSSLARPQHHAPLELATHTGLAGTTWLWGGRCVPFEAHDFEPRAQVPGVAWPLRWEDVQPWYEAAARCVDCGSAEFRRPLPPEAQGPVRQLARFELTQLERWSHQPRLMGSLGQQALMAPGLDLLFDTRVEALCFSACGSRVEGVQAVREGQALRLRARRFVLAGGALGVTRLLLLAQRERPTLFGGPDGPLGRYYMGHIMGSIARLVLARPQDVRWFDFSRDTCGTYVRRRLTPHAATQREQGLLNTSFYIDNPPFHDPSHRNPTLSAVFMGLAIAPIGRRLVAEAMRLKHIGPPPHRWVAHGLNIVRRPWRAALDVVDILRHRYLSSVRKPGFVLRNAGGTYALDYHAEQIPHAQSRVTLKNDQGDLKVDFGYQPQDIDSVLRTHALLDQDLRAAGLGHLAYDRPEAERAAHVFEQASDGFHQIGTTRMSADPAHGVVDANAQVHGVDNLYIASSSVFTTSGEANPTLLAVALGLRLADHLGDLLQAPAPASPQFAACAASDRTAPMRQITLPGTDLRLSRLVFGTASLHHLAREADRQALLRAAIEAGFSHVDTSPMYGNGVAEASLGALPPELARHLTLTTKVGLYAPAGARASIPDLYARKLLGKVLPVLNRAVVEGSVQRARLSFEASLRRLRRERVELLLLHEPVAAQIACDEWLKWLQNLQAQGQIGAWGVAGEAPAVAAMLASHGVLCPVVQVRDSVSQHQADVVLAAGRPLQLTYGYLADPGAAGQSVAQRLGQALMRNPDGAILVSTRQAQRLAELARLGS